MEHRNKIFFVAAYAGLLVLGFLNHSCYYDNEEYLYPATANCITENMSFATDVWPVINAGCTGCHSGASPSGGIALGNYTEVTTSAQIAAGNYGSLYGSISHASGNSPMPKSSNKLPDCTIAKIKAWIDQGALDN
jgi:hypothetical protein